MTMTAQRRRRLAAAVTAVAAVSALSACGSATTVGAASASGPPSAGALEAFCATIKAIDTARSQLGGGGSAPTPLASPAFAASSMVPEDGTEPTQAATPDPSAPDSFVYGTDATGADATGGDSGADATTTDASGGDTSATAEPTAEATGAAADSPSAQELADARVVYTSLIAQLVRDRQAEVGTEVDTMLRLARQALETGSFDLFDSPEFTAAAAKVDSFMMDKCG
jgi:hypothetical protein